MSSGAASNKRTFIRSLRQEFLIFAYVENVIIRRRLLSIFPRHGIVLRLWTTDLLWAQATTPEHRRVNRLGYRSVGLSSAFWLWGNLGRTVARDQPGLCLGSQFHW